MNILFFLHPKQEVAYVYDDCTLRQVLETMEHHKYASIPMLNRQGEYVGTITEGDLLWGVFSLAIMVLLRRTGGFSIQGVSIAGGVFHNIGQLLLAMMIVETYQVGYYFPVLLISGLVTGLLIGIVSSEVLKRTAFLKKAE